MGHLNGILARVGGNLNNNFQKSQIPWGLPRGGGILKLRFDRYIMQTNTVITPECTTLETIKAVFALFVAISTLHTACIALFYGQNIEQTVNTKVCRQILQVSIPRDSEFLSAFRARNHIGVGTRSLNPIQAVKAKAVQARQLFWLCELAHTHRTRNLFMKII